MADPTSDAVLTARLRASDPAAFRQLFERHYEPLYRFVARRLPSGQSETPADMVQDLFLRLWQRREALDPEQPVRAYLFSSANRLLIDRYRRQTVRQAYREAQASQPAPVAAPIEHFDVAPDVQAAIQALPEAVQHTFVLSRFDGLTYREIAALLEVSPKTVEARMSKALRLLRDSLRHHLQAWLAALLNLLQHWMGG
ncbi:MAG: sigma-70 family RNA polymerase sigma factor [Bacteroidota bacterium]